MIPNFDNSFVKVVPIDTLSNTASNATLFSLFCSFKDIPNFSKVKRSSGSISSRLLIFSFIFGAE